MLKLDPLITARLEVLLGLAKGLLVVRWRLELSFRGNGGIHVIDVDGGSGYGQTRSLLRRHAVEGYAGHKQRVDRVGVGCTIDLDRYSFRAGLRRLRNG